MNRQVCSRQLYLQNGLELDLALGLVFASSSSIPTLILQRGKWRSTWWCDCTQMLQLEKGKNGPRVQVFSRKTKQNKPKQRPTLSEQWFLKWKPWGKNFSFLPCLLRFPGFWWLRHWSPPPGYKIPECEHWNCSMLCLHGPRESRAQYMGVSWTCQNHAFGARSQVFLSGQPTDFLSNLLLIPSLLG